MSFLGDFELNLEDIDENASDLLPDGEYNVMVSDIELKDTASGEGKYVAIELTTMGNATNNNRKIWPNYNIVNGNAVAQNIGRAELKKMMKVAGYAKYNDPVMDELRGLKFSAKTKVKKGNDGYSDKVEVKGYKEYKELGDSADVPF